MPGFRGALIIYIAAVVVGSFSLRAYGLEEALGPGGSNAKAVHAIGQTGQGVKVGILGLQNVDPNHQAFNGVIVHNYAALGLSVYPDWHDTIMAGIIASQGWLNHIYDIGVSPGVEIHSFKISARVDISEGFGKLVNIEGCSVIVTGFHYSSEIANGSSDITLEYDYYAYNHNVVLVTASGQPDGDVNKITVPGDSFNSITTGGLVLYNPADETNYRKVGTISLPGPTIDGRKKPDVTAPSQSQTVPQSRTLTGTTNTNNYNGTVGATSWAIPHTAGTAALLLGLANQTAEINDGRNEVIKAVIVNSAFPNVDSKAGVWTNPADSNNTWHNDRGYGRIDAFGAYQLLDTTPVVRDIIINASKGWAWTQMDKNEQHIYFINGQKNHRLVMTIAWNRAVIKDNFGRYQAETSPFNVTLTIIDSNDNFIFSETDILNNLKKIDILLPADETYKIILTNTTDKTRNYAIAFELLSPILGDFEPLDYIVDEKDLLVLTEHWLDNSAAFDTNTFGEFVDFTYFARFASHWLENNPAYTGP